MRTSIARLYAPFLAIILVQALLVAVAPSTPTEQGALTGDGPGPGATAPPGAQGIEGPTGQGGTTTSGGTTPGTATGGRGTTGSGGGSTADSGPSGGDDDEGGAGSGPGVQRAAGTYPPNIPGDKSHCTEDGRQTDVIYDAPPCVANWPEDRDNGGATYRGVSSDEIKIIYFRSESNPLVDQILATQGLAASEEEFRQMNDAAVKFLNEHFELYGREIVWEDVVGDCPQTPPDPEACRQAAREAANKDPFMILWPTPLYPSVFDEWVREGIISLGGWHFDETQFTKRRPFRYDAFMDGTRSANVIAEYYCKKLAGENVSHSGPVVHPEIGARGQVGRKLGIVVPKTETNIATAETVQQQVAECDGQEPPIFSYESNIETAQQQSTATTAALIDAGVTTVVCMCDLIAPRFATQEATNQNYYPEWLLPGLGLLDYDLVGRLYDQQQWQHAFGPSHLNNPVDHSQSDASKIWRAAGNEGDACQSCGLQTAYWVLAGIMIQMSGPELHPINVERNVVGAEYVRGGWERTGRDPTQTMTRFGPDDYTALEDAREVIWRPERPSRIDGRPGSYEPIDGGRRYENGQWPATFDVPRPSGG